MPFCRAFLLSPNPCFLQGGNGTRAEPPSFVRSLECLPDHSWKRKNAQGTSTAAFDRSRMDRHLPTLSLFKPSHLLLCSLSTKVIDPSNTPLLVFPTFQSLSGTLFFKPPPHFHCTKPFWPFHFKPPLLQWPTTLPFNAAPALSPCMQLTLHLQHLYGIVTIQNHRLSRVVQPPSRV